MDQMAQEAAEQMGFPTKILPAQWERYGRSAGFKRNQLIVEAADIVIAFFADGPQSAGTSHTVALAHAAGKPIRIYHQGEWS